MKSQNSTLLVAGNFSLFVTLILASIYRPHFVQAVWPNPPFIDVCTGSPEQGCRNTAQCGWFTDRLPRCFDTEFKKQVPPYHIHPTADRVKRFFDFHFGIHLSEGTFQAVYYNMNHTACAFQCLRSAGEARNIRCLSFDFYPFEEPLQTATTSKDYGLSEDFDRGVCILNSHDSGNARLRNEDQGLTDSELFYTSHYTNRPFSNLDGYYDVRNPRGGDIARMLEFGGLSESDVNINIVWGGSRWGIFHLTNLRELAREREIARVQDGGNAGTPLLRVGFTPVNTDQHCPGVMSKADAEQICSERGGFLCKDQDEVEKLKFRKLGCSYDNGEVWSEADNPDSGPKFVRCCGEYSTLITSEADCEERFVEPIDECGQYTSFIDCVQQGSGFEQQVDDGFGKRLEHFRDMCKATGMCRDALMRQWRPRDKCVWCLDSANLLENRNTKGSCRPAAFGLCPNAEESDQIELALKLRAACRPSSLETIVEAYPEDEELRKRLIDPLDSDSPLTVGTAADIDARFCANYDESKESCQEVGCTWYENVPEHWIQCRPECYFPGNQRNCEQRTGCQWENEDCVPTPTPSPTTTSPTTAPPTTSPSPAPPTSSPSASPDSTNAPVTPEPTKFPTFPPTEKPSTLSPVASTVLNCPTTDADNTLIVCENNPAGALIPPDQDPGNTPIPEYCGALCLENQEPREENQFFSGCRSWSWFKNQNFCILRGCHPDGSGREKATVKGGARSWRSGVLDNSCFTTNNEAPRSESDVCEYDNTADPPSFSYQETSSECQLFQFILDPKLSMTVRARLNWCEEQCSSVVENCVGTEYISFHSADACNFLSCTDPGRILPQRVYKSEKRDHSCGV